MFKTNRSDAVSVWWHCPFTEVMHQCKLALDLLRKTNKVVVPNVTDPRSLIWAEEVPDLKDRRSHPTDQGLFFLPHRPAHCFVHRSKNQDQKLQNCFQGYTISHIYQRMFIVDLYNPLAPSLAELFFGWTATPEPYLFSCNLHITDPDQGGDIK